jgi:homopolymeric O-antigen transport system ATP-binding protein
VSEVVIHGEGLGKTYRRGLPVDTGLRHVLDRFVRDPLATLRRSSYETFWALKDVSLEVKEGEVLGLIGRNGAGKTTLLKILSRITRPTTGWAEIRGRVRSLLEVGTGFHGELTGRENTYLSGSILGMTKREIDRKFDEIVAFAEIDKFIDTPVKHYSSGMYVRLAFAVAAHLEPEILLVDEVLAVGDVAFQRKCLGKMKEVGSHGRTIVFVSHNVNAVASLCSSAMVLADGKVAFCSNNVQEALHLYLSSPNSAYTVDLSDHPGRVGDHAILQRVTIYDASGAPSFAILPGSNVAIDIKIQPRDRINMPRVSIGVNSERGERLFAIGTHIGGNHIPNMESPSTIRVRFRMPPLVPGQYSLDIGFYDRTGAALDAIYGAAYLDILKDDYLSMTEGHSHHFGYIMVPSEWTSVQDNEERPSELLAARDTFAQGNNS